MQLKDYQRFYSLVLLYWFDVLFLELPVEAEKFVERVLLLNGSVRVEVLAEVLGRADGDSRGSEAESDSVVVSRSLDIKQDSLARLLIDEDKAAALYVKVINKDYQTTLNEVEDRPESNP